MKGRLDVTVGKNYMPLDFNRIIWNSDSIFMQKEHLEKSITNMKLVEAIEDDIKKIIGRNAARILGWEVS